MLTEKDYCDYDTCVALKELGITYFGLHFYKIGYPETLHHNYMQYLTERTAGALGRVLAIPLYSAQKWLREERNIDILPRRGCITNDKQRYQVVIYINYNRNQILLDNDGEDYSSPEEALSEGIKEAVKILKENEDGRM